MPTPVPGAAPASPGMRYAAAGAVAAFVGAVAIIVACALPYANITDNSVSQTAPSIFNPGYPGALWYAVEPVAVAALAVAAGVMLIALRGRTPRALAAGVMIGMGAQTFLLFVGYVASSASGPSERAAIGGAFGVAGGLVVAVGGALAAVSLSVRARAAP